MPEYGNEKADICLKDREQMSAFWMKWNLGNLITAFIGVLGLKVSAYLQPFTHRVIQKLQGRGDVSSDSEDNNFI